MKRLILKSFIIFIPFGFVFTTIFLIDPYSFFNNEYLINKTEKNKLSTNEVLTSLISFKNNPKENIILGDSRAMLLKIESIKKISGLNFFNLSFGAGNLNEAISTFDFVKSKIRIKNVVFCINIELYNQANLRNRVEGVIHIFKNPLFYFTNINVLESTYYILKKILLKSGSNIIKIPDMSKEDFWQHQLNESATRYYSNYIYPEIYKKKLLVAASFCKSNNIKYAFVIMPTHVDLQKAVSKYNFNKINSKFLKDLSELGTVYDFNYENEFTKIKINFKDPFHVDDSQISFIIAKVFKNIDTNYCIQYGETILWNY